MELVDELQRLSDLRAAGSLTEVEFSAAKARLITGHDRPTGPVGVVRDFATQHQIKMLRADAALARLDGEWLVERERYIKFGNFGAQFLPNKWWTVAFGGFAFVFGIFWTVAVWRTGAPVFFRLWGVMITGGIVVQAVLMYRRACAYEAAKEKYQLRRAELMAEADLAR